jgi:hypothetical protein
MRMRMRRAGLLLAVALAAVCWIASSARADDARGSVRTYQVRQIAKLDEVPEGARHVRWWISMPNEGPDQRLLDFDVVSAPGSWRVVRDAKRAQDFLLVEVDDPDAPSLEVTCVFTLRRRPVQLVLDAARAGAVTETHRKLYADDLRRDTPHLEVTAEIEKRARSVCGDETNVVRQARLLLDHVADVADHYSKDPSKPRCGVGDAAACVTQGGGCCTDLHSLFIALARARGIPARLAMGYRLLPHNAGKEVDPGYRCWAEYFVPGYGWVPADIVEADAPDGLGRGRWFSGLTEHRLWLNTGREFVLAADVAPVSTMSIGYALIDGVPARLLPEGERAAQLTRRVRFTEVAAPDAAPVHAKTAE